MRYRSWQAGDSWAVLVDVREDPARRLLIRDIEAFRRAPQRGGRTAVGKTYRRSLERHVLDVLARREVEARLRALGFSVRVSRRYGEVELPPRRLAFMARKQKPEPGREDP